MVASTKKERGVLFCAETPRRIQLSRKKGFRLPANTVVVARPSKWGNPFKADPTDPAYCVYQFRKLIEFPSRSGIELRRALPGLRGKNLACWCPLGAPCHADVLLELANTEPKASAS